MKRSNEVDIFLEAFADQLLGFGADIGVIQFGSSIGRKQFSNQLDIDLLLLSSHSRYDDFTGKIKQLRHSMMTGEFAEGFPLNDQFFAYKVNNYLNQANSSTVKFIPKFVFGPMKMCPSNGRLANVYLHFKGPVTCDQFIEFGQHFPFHASSIIQHSKLLAGEFDPSRLALKASINESTYNEFSNALRLKTSNCQNAPLIWKCIKKLMQNYFVLTKVDYDPCSEFRQLLKIHFDRSLPEQASVQQLKSTFFELQHFMNQRRPEFS